MQKYCLEWQGDGSLDLSQVLDEHGVPVIFPRRGATAIVDARTFSHPHIQNYLKAGLKGTAVSPGAPRVIDSPAPPMAPSPPATVAAPPVAPEVIAPPVVSEPPPEPKRVTVPLVDTVPLKETEVATAASEVDSTESEPADSKRRRGRGK